MSIQEIIPFWIFKKSLLSRALQACASPVEIDVPRKLDAPQLPQQLVDVVAQVAGLHFHGKETAVAGAKSCLFRIAAQPPTASPC